MVYARCMSFSMLTLKVEAHQGSPQCLEPQGALQILPHWLHVEGYVPLVQHGPLQYFHSHSEKLWWEVWTGLNTHALSLRQSSALVSVHPTPTTASFTHHCILKPVCLNSIENFPAVLNLYYSIFQKCRWSCVYANPPSKGSLSAHSWLAGWWDQLATTLPHRDVWK